MSKRITELTPAELAAALPTKKKKLVGTPPTVTVGESLQLLARHDILSLAIFSTYRPDQVVNIVNVKDLLGHILGINDPKSSLAIDAHQQLVDPKATFNPNEAAARLRQNIEAVMTLDADKESYRVLEAEMTESLAPIIEAFGHRNAHRALAIDHVNNAEPFVLSQTDVLVYVREHPESLPDPNMLNRTIMDMGIVKKSPSSDLVCATEEETALAAYTKMARADFLALPILDVHGRIGGNLSASDLRGKTGADLELFNLPVGEFLKKVRHGAERPVITTTPKCTLKELLNTFHDNRIHRVWVVDDKGKPYDVASMTDVCQAIAKAK